MEILKDLLKKTLEPGLNRLEKRAKLQMDDLKYEKQCYNKQGKLLEWLCSIKIEPKKKKEFKLKRDRSAETIRKNNTYNPKLNKIRDKTPELNNIKRISHQNNNNRNKTPNNNNRNKGIPSYMKSTSSSQNNQKEQIHGFYYNLRKQREEEEKKKRNLTPEPKIKKIAKTKNINVIKEEEEFGSFNIHNDIKQEKQILVSNINDIMLKSNNIILDNKKEEEDLKISVEKKDEKKFKDIGEFLTSKENSKFVNLILSYLNKEEQMTFVLNNKKFIPYLTTIIENYKEQFEKKCQINSILTLEQKKKELLTKFPNSNITEVPNYIISSSAEKSLNFINYNNRIFKTEILEKDQEKIIIIYRIFFQLIKKEEIVKIKNDLEFWKKTCEYINENSDGKTGDFFKNSTNNFDTSASNLFKINKIIEGNEDKITVHNYYSSICGTTALVCLLIRDVLEFVGVIPNEKKNNPQHLYQNLEYLIFVYEKISDYVKRLKNAEIIIDK